MSSYFETKDLTVGYHKIPLIHNINIQIEKGKILTLIGPNGAGKSTILKSITRHLAKISGTVSINKYEIDQWSGKEFAQQVAVVLTDRIHPELTSCEEIVAMGRYPYTNMLGKLTQSDQLAVDAALEQVHASTLAKQDFSTLSDGQKQRIMLARAICQEPEVIVLDEPTAYLDIRHKIELLDILRTMAKEKEITVIMSLHEIDLAAKISDYLLCVKGETIHAFGTPDQVLCQDTMESLYEMEKGSYNLLFGSVELAKNLSDPDIFIVAGGGCGIPCYRALQRKGHSFATGVLFENDVDYQVASALSNHVISACAFEPITEEHFYKAANLLLECRCVIDAGTPIGTFNQANGRLLQLAKQHEIPIYKNCAHITSFS